MLSLRNTYYSYVRYRSRYLSYDKAWRRHLYRCTQDACDDVTTSHQTTAAEATAAGLLYKRIRSLSLSLSLSLLFPGCLCVSLPLRQSVYACVFAGGWHRVQHACDYSSLRLYYARGRGSVYCELLASSAARSSPLRQPSAGAANDDWVGACHRHRYHHHSSVLIITRGWRAVGCWPRLNRGVFFHCRSIDERYRCEIALRPSVRQTLIMCRNDRMYWQTILGFW